MAKILIVDDEKDLGSVLCSILKLEGHETALALDGYEAIELIKKERYDLIFMDIRLPGINGVETFIRIKKIDPAIKVVMMTGFSVEDLMEQALREGAYACIHKPFDVQKVIKLIEQIISENKKVILIVNGDSTTREKVKTALIEKNYNVCTAKDGEEAIAKLKDKQYDCILLNLTLPGINGLSILKQAKELYPAVVVIVMSDCELPEMIREAEILSAAYAYIKKPIDIEELIGFLKKANL
ncbi:hypothetical protein CO110_09080 [Candidatus Desantisbacteria bacterium CG_4_9_14_3_um_filter_40_11]|uniref:Response regulatory domain-containing protein n=1 Tax=Candidatus Desantisbacteria bacterium CG_4_9_14_3_um_filter_40_11 TaxID=1974546 RepID=A0A2M8ARU1_9BACT|nr:MAG: hypothetical protein CO110_09080 [Candidatus Desantisbacteria bacterium CG_4_9_14_3_um_filter_40_11]